MLHKLKKYYIDFDSNKDIGTEDIMPIDLQGMYGLSPCFISFVILKIEKDLSYKIIGKNCVKFIKKNEYD